MIRPHCEKSIAKKVSHPPVLASQKKQEDKAIAQLEVSGEEVRKQTVNRWKAGKYSACFEGGDMGASFCGQDLSILISHKYTNWTKSSNYILRIMEMLMED